MIRVGLISDTHGLLRPEALRALEGSAHILHAGDIGDASILEKLASIARVTAVRGNNDIGPWAKTIREIETVEIGGTSICMIHDLSQLPKAGQFAAVVSGHSHKPKVERKDGVLYVNPGSAGPRRFTLPISLGFLTIEAGKIEAELLRLGA